MQKGSRISSQPSAKNIRFSSFSASFSLRVTVHITKIGVASPKTRHALTAFFGPFDAKISRNSGRFWGWHLFCQGNLGRPYKKDARDRFALKTPAFMRVCRFSEYRQNDSDKKDATSFLCFDRTLIHNKFII